MQKNYFAILKTINENNLRKFAVIFYSFYTVCGLAQNSMVGDGFGGRLWYKPYNYSVGSYSAYTICGDSSQLYGWGGNEYGQLGDGTLIGRAIPGRVSGMSNVYFYSTGYIMGAIKYDKTGWVWGNLTGGKPIKVINKVKFMDAGMNVCSFVKTDGTVWSVGSNSDGSFGNEKITDSITLLPQKMIGISNAVRVANSGSNNTILLSDGTVMQAGLNFHFTKSLLPEKITTLSNIIDIKANNHNAIALDKNGFVYSWGSGRNGCIGNGTKFDSRTPQLIANLSNIIAISGCNDGDHFLALDANHNCYAWGYNGFGQCGVIDDNILTPIIVATEVNDILAGERFSYIIKSNGEIWAAGMSKEGSIWMNLKDEIRTQFTKINFTFPSITLCEPTFAVSKPYRSLYIRMCPGDSITIGSNVHKSEGRFHDTIINNYGMDTIVSTTIRFNHVSTYIQDISICAGRKFTIGSNTYFRSGRYIDKFNNYLGCDSNIITNLIVKSNSYSSHSVKLCRQEQYKAGNNTHTDPGIYQDTISNSCGCDSVITTLISELSSPYALFDFSNNPVSIDDSFQLINLSVNADKYLWRFGPSISDTTSIKHPLMMYRKDGLKDIQLTAVNSFTGCRNTISKTIEISDKTEVYIPSTITPNADGINDYFYPVARNYDAITMQIFNQWGELIYQTNQWDNGWNGSAEGKACMQSVYFYKIELSNTSPVKSKVFSGTLTLLR